jgi:signal transduction histidine kinase
MSLHDEELRYEGVGGGWAHGERLATLGLMTAGVVHDLSNHLQVAAAAIHLLELEVDEAANQQIHVLTGGALEALQRANALTRRIVRFSRDGDVGLPDTVSVDEALAGMGDALRWTAGPAVRLHLDLGGGAAATRCDVREFENAVLNLVANARDASPDGGTIFVAVRRDPLSHSVLVAVRDEGCGMAPECARRAFEPFFTTRPTHGGSGLGLARVADFARRVGGDASLASAPGAGATFVLRLPESQPLGDSAAQ